MTKVATLVENQHDRTKKVTMSITKSSSKIYESSLYNKAVNDLIHGDRQREAIKEELQNLENHWTLEYNEFPYRWKAIGLKWIFKVKYHPDGSVIWFKARLIAQEFSQVYGINFSETFAPTIRKKLLQIYLAFCLILNLFIYYVDIIAVYLESLLGDNKLPIFIKLLLKMHHLCEI